MTLDEQRLLRAASFGQSPELVRLLEQGVNLSVRNGAGDNPLHLAAWSGRTECVQILLSFGADPSVRNSRDATPLHLAAWQGHGKRPATTTLFDKS